MLSPGRVRAAAALALAVLGSACSRPVAAAQFSVTSLYTDAGCHSAGASPTTVFVGEQMGCKEFTVSCAVTPNSDTYYYETECTEDYEDFLSERFPQGDYLLENYYTSATGCFNWYALIAYPLDGLCHPSGSDGAEAAVVTLDSEGSVAIDYYVDSTCTAGSYLWTAHITAANIEGKECQQIEYNENTTYYNKYDTLTVSSGSGSDASSGSLGSTKSGSGPSGKESSASGSPGTGASDSETSGSTLISSAESTGSLSTAALAGIIAGGVVLLLVVVGAICCCLRRKERQEKRPSRADTPEATGTSDPYWSMQQRNVGIGINAAGNPGGSMWEDDAIVAARIPRDRVMFEGLLSRGGYGEVYAGTYNGQRVAIKTLLPERRKQIRHVNDFLAEVKMMASLDHPRIVQFIGVAWDSLTNLCVVSEYMSGGDLRALLSSYEASRHPQGFDYNKVKIAMHIAHALTYLHSLQPMIIHRDLKSRNVLLDDELNAKLTDFGVSRERVDATMTAGVGTSLWMAPEIMMGERYDDKADVFSFGVMLSELDLHELPYANAKDATGTGRKMPDTAILQLVMLGKLRVSFSSGAMADVVELGYSCVDVDPLKRPTSAEVLYKLHLVLRSFG